MLLLAALVACAPHPSPPVVAADTVTLPVTLDAFRDAFPVGTTIRLQIAASGAPTVVQRWEWTAVDAEGCTIAATVYDAAGALLEDEGASRTTWTELMSHATFPAAVTERTEGTTQVPAGRFDTWIYTVRDADDAGVPRVRRFHFAKTLPGPPLLYTIEQGGDEIFRMTMLERTGSGG